MLTAAQCETVAYMSEDGELFCPDCFDRGDVFARPVIRYSLDEWQTARAEDYEWPPEEDGQEWGDSALQEKHEECEPALHCDGCSGELLEEYHWHIEEDGDGL